MQSQSVAFSNPAVTGARPIEFPAIVLAVDHDPALRGAIADFLGRSGFEVICAADATEARQLLNAYDVELLVLGQVASVSGIDLCRALPETALKPVIVIADAADQMERILALELGADDLLPRSVDLRELLARARALLRRSRRETRETREPVATGWGLSMRRRAIINPSGKVISLTNAEYALLNAFVEAPWGLLTLKAAAAAETGNPLAALRTAINRLRRKIGDTEGRIIRTITGRGYILDINLLPI